MQNIEIKGARIHNLKNIDISIPKNKLIVATGVSGSGKSSLVFDIIFEEGRRQYLQSLGILTDLIEEKKFDSITGIAPAVAVKQNIIRQSSPRSTVGSRTKILGMLSLLFARDGQLACPSCGAVLDKNLRCENCGSSAEPFDASYFSYNAPNGMCLKCAGRGTYYEINLEKLVPDQETNLQQVLNRVGGITPGYMRLLQRQFKGYLDTPFFELPPDVMDEVVYGHYVNNNFQKRSYCLTRILEIRVQREGEDLSGVYTMVECAECGGARVGEEARSVTLNGKHIGDLGKMTIIELQDFLSDLAAQEQLSDLGKKLVEAVMLKTRQLIKSRLGHLTLYREMPTLSGGEIQRLFLNAHLDSKMDSLIYILDEPTIGLHESEKAELLKAIYALKEQGNTVIVVEYDRKTIAMAEEIIDIGPKAGIEGGQIVYQGDLPGLLNAPNSITGQYLSGKRSLPKRKRINFTPDAPQLCIKAAQTNNLKNLTVHIPLGGLVGVAGVSGSGKSSLISNTLVPLLKGHFKDQAAEKQEPGESILVQSIAEKLEGCTYIKGYAEVTQAPIGRNTNSNPATYIGIWDKIRKLYAQQPQARELDLSAGHFSFNSKGACDTCGGSGSESLRLGGSLQIEITCRDCEGKRYHDTALTVRYQGKNIYDIPNMSLSEALQFLAEQPAITNTMRVMERIGMGYIKLGQPTPTLSGGEAQRIKLAKEIGRRRKGNILYVLDEPTTGLSMYDTAKLIELLDELVTKGNSVLIIEHDTLVLSECDWIIELGPGAGKAGGQIIAAGRPESLKSNPNSITGRYLS